MQFLICLVIAFTLSEAALLFSKRSKTGTVKNRNDKRSLLLLWIIVPVCLITGNIISRYHIWQFNDPAITMTAGIVIAIAGFFIRWIAIMQLGKLFTVDVAISTTHTLKTSGLYKIVRHPSYLGLIMIVAGFALCLNNGLSLLIILIPVFLAVNYRIRIEERVLTNEFGDQYIHYKNHVARIIPGIY
jgi:protein-S-isoprenylcysteine O-methyltransferase Ste14